MPRRHVARLALLAATSLGGLTVAGLAAPAAYADGEPQPPCTAHQPEQSQASLYAAPLTDPHGRKLA